VLVGDVDGEVVLLEGADLLQGLLHLARALVCLRLPAPRSG